VELTSHGLTRLDSDDIGTSLPQQHADDSGTRTDIGDLGARQATACELLDAVKERRWVRRPTRRVLSRGYVERLGARAGRHTHIIAPPHQAFDHHQPDHHQPGEPTRSQP
jgi:hypothetical protein